jgi:hypothetical protein
VLEPEPDPVEEPDPDPVPVKGATAANWHLKPPAFFLLLDLNWILSHLALFVAGRISPIPSSYDP